MRGHLDTGHRSTVSCCIASLTVPHLLVLLFVVIFILVANLIKGNIGWDFGGIDDNTNS